MLSKITFEPSAEALGIVFKPAPGSKTDALCVLPPNGVASSEVLASGSASRR